jgi:hypothetical protein
MKRRWNHATSFLTGAGTLGLFLAGHGWILLLVGFALGLSVALAGRWTRRLFGRLDRALPDRGKPAPFMDDPDYLAGVERGIRSARRSAGIEDGRLAELDQLTGRGFA